MTLASPDELAMLQRNATPLHLAVRRESAEVVELLVLARADVHAKDDVRRRDVLRAAAY